jgi:hypothetical protein
MSLRGWWRVRRYRKRLEAGMREWKITVRPRSPEDRRIEAFWEELLAAYFPPQQSLKRGK